MKIGDIYMYDPNPTNSFPVAVGSWIDTTLATADKADWGIDDVMAALCKDVNTKRSEHVLLTDTSTEKPMITETVNLAYAMFATDPDLLEYLNKVTEGHAQDHIEKAWERDELGLTTKYLDRAERMSEWLDPFDTSQDPPNPDYIDNAPDYLKHLEENTVFFDFKEFYGKGI